MRAKYLLVSGSRGRAPERDHDGDQRRTEASRMNLLLLMSAVPVASVVMA
jgi:hypothetical protein